MYQDSFRHLFVKAITILEVAGLYMLENQNKLYSMVDFVESY